MIQAILFIFTLCFFLAHPLSSEDVIKSVRYLKQEASFSEVSDLYLKDGIITRITPSKQSESVRYVIPSFCDAYITLGVDAVGGQNNLQAIQTSLRSFLYHGVTHVLSVADGSWIHKIKSEIDSGKLLGPKITIASRPLIPKSSEVKDISDVLYFPVDNSTSAFSELERQLTGISRSVHIFNRYNHNASFSFDSGLLNQLRLEAKDKNKIITVHTFGDRISVLDALISGNRYLVHPILYEMETEITKQHKEEINLIPILNVYRNSYLNNLEGSEGLIELEMLKKKDKFFLDYYASIYEGSLGSELDSKEIETRQSDYLSYTKFIEKNPILKQKLILGSGAGNRLSFPGVSYIQELQILGKILKNDENLFRIPTQNSCSYIGGSYNGVLAVGKEANLIVLKENPVKNINTLFEIEQVFQFGKLVRFNSATAKKIPKKK